MKQSIAKLPPLPFFVAVFTQPCHHLLLQLRNREAFKRRVTTRRLGRSEELDPVLGQLLRGPVGAGGVVAGDFEAGNVILQHIGDILEAAEAEQSPSLELEGLLEPRGQSQSRVDQIQSRRNLSVLLGRD